MKSRITLGLLGSTRDHKRAILTNRLLQASGAKQHNLGVPLQDGPCFQYSEQTLAWLKGWKLTNAFYKGHETGLRGGMGSDNPYGNGLHNRPENSDLANEWLKGFRAGCVASDRLII